MTFFFGITPNIALSIFISKLMFLSSGAREDTWEPLGHQGYQTSQSERKSTLNTHWKDWCWSWSSNILATWCKQMTHWKRPWCWERLKAGGEGDNKGWDGWIVSLIQWHELGQTLGYGEGQEGLACCSPWGHKESDTTERVNDNNRDVHVYSVALALVVSNSLQPHGL